MSYMFGDESFTRYESLLSLANVSKWDTRNVVVMNNMFSYCSSLLSMPDISK